MQDRYTGDVGDFGKYGLLRALCGTHDSPRLRLGVFWYLVHDETHNDDGRHTSYLRLQKPAYRDCDPELFDQMRALFVASSGEMIAGNRLIASIERSSIFPPCSLFFNERLEYEKGKIADRLLKRAEWIKGALSKTVSAELIFMDPDNGVECQSVGRTALTAPKYAFWDEIKSFADRRQTVVIYHHFNHSCPTETQTDKLRLEFCKKMPPEFETYTLIFRRGTRRAYFVSAPPEHREIVRNRIHKFLTGPWKGNQHFL